MLFRSHLGGSHELERVRDLRRALDAGDAALNLSDRCHGLVAVLALAHGPRDYPRSGSTSIVGQVVLEGDGLLEGGDGTTEAFADLIGEDATAGDLGGEVRVA